MLADLLEKPRGHAATEGGREHLRGVDVVVAIAGAFEGQRKMHLLERFDDEFLAATEARGFDHVRRAALQVAEELLGLGDELVVVDCARGREDHLLGRVVLGDEAREVRLGKGAHTLRGAEDRAAQGLFGIGLFLQPVEDHVVGGVEDLADFLQDHAALDLDLAFVEDRVQHDIGDHVEREGHVVLQHARVIGGHLAARVGVDVAAHVLDFLGDLQRGAPLGPLEGHMLEKMRDAVLFQPLMPPAGLDPDADRGGFQPRHEFRNDAEPVGQGMQLDGHCASLSRIRVWIAARSFGTSVTRSGRS